MTFIWNRQTEMLFFLKMLHKSPSAHSSIFHLLRSNVHRNGAKVADAEVKSFASGQPQVPVVGRMVGRNAVVQHQPSVLVVDLDGRPSQPQGPGNAQCPTVQKQPLLGFGVANGIAIIHLNQRTSVRIGVCGVDRGQMLAESGLGQVDGVVHIHRVVNVDHLLSHGVLLTAFGVVDVPEKASHGGVGVGLSAAAWHLDMRVRVDAEKGMVGQHRRHLAAEGYLLQSAVGEGVGPYQRDARRQHDFAQRAAVHKGALSYGGKAVSVGDEFDRLQPFEIVAEEVGHGAHPAAHNQSCGRPASEEEVGHRRGVFGLQAHLGQVSHARKGEGGQVAHRGAQNQRVDPIAAFKRAVHQGKAVAHQRHTAQVVAVVEGAAAHNGHPYRNRHRLQPFAVGKGSRRYGRDLVGGAVALHLLGYRQPSLRTFHALVVAAGKGRIDAHRGVLPFGGDGEIERLPAHRLPEVGGRCFHRQQRQQQKGQ